MRQTQGNDCDAACAEVLRRLEAFLDDECPQDLRSVVVEHLEACHPCLDRADFERAVREMIASKCRDAAPPGLADRVVARLRLSVT